MKKIFCLALIMSISISVFSQGITKDSVEKVVREKHENLLKNIDSKSKSIKFGDAKKQFLKQFLLEDSKVAVFISENRKGKEPDISTVYNTIYNTIKHGDCNCIFEFVNLGGPEQKGAIKKISKKYISIPYQTRSEIHTRVKTQDFYSNAKYNVTFNWHVKAPVDKNDSTLIKNIDKDMVKLDSIETVPIDYTIAEKDKMTKIAEDSIAKWYMNLKENLEGKSYISLLPIKQEMKKGKGQLRGQTYTKQDTVSIYIKCKDAEQYPWLYDEEAKDHYSLNMTITVHIADDLKTIDSLFDNYEVGDTILAETNNEKVKRQKSADSITHKFLEKLRTYSENPSEIKKSELTSMFIDKENEVIEVSRRFKFKNIEKINNRLVGQYLDKLAKLKPTNIEINIGEPSYCDLNMETVIYPFHQEYNSRTYNDETDKKLHLKYVNEKYVIEKITVVSNSTILK